MTQILNLLQQALSSVGPFFLLLGLLIFVHELGHFLVAKLFKVRVEVFSLGFGKKILQIKRGETTYCLSLIPLGGYVKMYGDDPSADVPETEKQRAFLHKPVSQRIWIVLAGPLMNFFFAVAILTFIALHGEHLTGGEIGDIAPGTQAADMGFQSGDRIVKVNGQPVVLWSDISERIQDSAQKQMTFDVARGDEHVKITGTPQWGDKTSILSTRDKVGQIEGLSTESLAPVVGLRSPDSVAAVAGVKALDQILSLNGKEVHYFRELDERFAEAMAANQPLVLKVRPMSLDGTDVGLEERTVTIPNQTLKPKQNPLDVLGLESPELYLARIKKDSPAAKAGFVVGDRVLSLNGRPLTSWKDIVDQVSKFQTGQEPYHFEVRRDGQTLKMEVSPELTTLMTAKGQEEKRQTIGVYPAMALTTAAPVFYQIRDPLKAIGIGFKKSYELSQMVVMSIVRLVQNQVSARNIGGVISIGRFASQSYEMGMIAFLKMMALISINLFLLNLLPVPVLDGGHLVFFSIEAIKGAPLGLKKMELAQQVGLILLISLMVFAIFNDISNLIRPPW